MIVNEEFLYLETGWTTTDIQKHCICICDEFSHSAWTIATFITYIIALKNLVSALLMNGLYVIQVVFFSASKIMLDIPFITTWY